MSQRKASQNNLNETPLILAGGEAALDQQVEAELTRAGRDGAAPGDLASHLADSTGLGSEIGRREVTASLDRLATQGRALERARRWYALAATDYTAGRVDRIDGGDALIRPLTDTSRRGEPAFVVEASQLKGALDGDLVIVKRAKGKHRSLVGRSLPPANVVTVAERRSQTLVGTLDTDPDGLRWLTPFATGLDLNLEIVDGAAVNEMREESGKSGGRKTARKGRHEVPDGHYVVAEVIRGSGSRSDSHPRGTVIEHLGAIETPGTDVLAVLRHYSIPDDLPAEVVAEAAELPEDPQPADWQGRADLRDVLTVTIDGATARDFDDAITCQRQPNGHWSLGVHIADVAHYVQPGSGLDREAYRRGTSVYYPDRAIPMLPERLSNGLCSLRPNVPRLAMSAFLDIDPDGIIQRTHFTQSVIESDRRLTYEEVSRVLEKPAKGDRKEYGDVLDLLERCRELMTLLNRERRERGSIDFDLPSGDIVLDTDGRTVGVTPGNRMVAHRIVEEFMIAANEAVAFALDDVSSPSLYRVHDAPPEDDLQQLADVLRGVGIKLPKDLDRLHPRHLQEVMDQVEGRPEETFITSLVLRTMQRAVYSPDCRGHYALASRHYTHFTSPIRRYPDLVVHRGLKAFIAHEDEAGEGPFSLRQRLPGIAAHTSFTERRAERSERDLLQWKKVRFLAERVGETFEGRISGVQPFGFFVVLDGLFVDGLVPIRTMSDDYYVFKPEEHRWIGSNNNRVFRLGDAVKVRLTGVSQAHRGLDLEIADLAERKGKGRGRSEDQGSRKRRPSGRSRRRS